MLLMFTYYCFKSAYSFNFIIMKSLPVATTLHGHTLFVRPQYDQLIELLDTLVNWQKFGTFLTGIERRDIERIEADTSIKGIDQQKAALFTKWLSVHPEASWEDVLFALEKSQEYSLVSRVYQKLNSTLSTASTISQSIIIIVIINNNVISSCRSSRSGKNSRV